MLVCVPVFGGPMCHLQTYTIPWGLIADLRAFLSKHSIYRLATMGLTGDAIGAPQPVHKTCFEKKSKYYADRTQAIL